MDRLPHLKIYSKLPGCRPVNRSVLHEGMEGSRCSWPRHRGCRRGLARGLDIGKHLCRPNTHMNGRSCSWPTNTPNVCFRNVFRHHRGLQDGLISFIGGGLVATSPSVRSPKNTFLEHARHPPTPRLDLSHMGGILTLNTRFKFWKRYGNWILGRYHPQRTPQKRIRKIPGKSTAHL